MEYQDCGNEYRIVYLFEPGLPLQVFRVATGLKDALYYYEKIDSKNKYLEEIISEYPYETRRIRSTNYD